MKSNFSSKEIAEASSYSGAIARFTSLLEGKASEGETLRESLRTERNFFWREAALSTFFNKSTTSEIVRDWSLATENIVKRAWQSSGCDKLGLVLMAMGKLGANELNLSSDIDLIVLSNKSVTKEAQKALNEFRSLLNDVDENGFCYRVDFDLRPGGRAGPIISTIKQFEDYLWTQAELWERLAYVRMRTIAGDAVHIQEVQDLVQRFVYRKFLDFPILEEFKNLRTRIQHEYAVSESNQRWSLKHSPGGIRDIELFINSLQVMHGGRLSGLKTVSTERAMSSIKTNKLFAAEACDHLINSYWNLRGLEHWMQMKDDLQTYDWNANSNAPSEIQKAANAAKTQLSKNVDHIEAVLGSLNLNSTAKLEAESPDLLMESLEIPNFDLNQFSTKWNAIRSNENNPNRDKTRKDFILNEFIRSLPNPKVKGSFALESLYDFLNKGRSHGGLLDLLTHQPLLVKDLALLFSSSSYLGKIIIDRPELLDSFLYRMTESSATDEQDFLEKIFERRLLNEIIAGIEYVKSNDLSALSRAQTLTADQITTDVLQFITENFKSGIKILALGKWGSEELGFKSDLDFIFVKSSAPVEADFKVAKRFVSRISEPHRGGAIYEIDLRLRPSGKAGPMIVSEDQLLTYFESKAEAWERQSYLLARVIGDNDSISGRLKNVIISRGLEEAERDELYRIRSQLLRPLDSQNIDIKFCAGGLVDIELFLQAEVLRQALTAKQYGSLRLLGDIKTRNSEYYLLFKNYSYLKSTEQFLRLTSGFKETTLSATSSMLVQLSVLMANDNLLQQIEECLMENCNALMKLDPRRKPI